jgi:hypothetical protein
MCVSLVEFRACLAGAGKSASTRKQYTCHGSGAPRAWHGDCIVLRKRAQDAGAIFHF